MVDLQKIIRMSTRPEEFIMIMEEVHKIVEDSPVNLREGCEA